MSNSLHKLIPDNELPEPLKRPLIFGNKEQIDALYAMEAEQAKIADGKLKYFDVCIAYSGEQHIKILAVDKADAKKKAREEASDYEADMEIDYVNAREVKPCVNRKELHK